jgi:hypothetical protein
MADVRRAAGVWKSVAGGVGADEERNTLLGLFERSC